ncbi:protein ecdysoneless-like protein [Gossypium australe]|uniref:Protein ecdysoneless-like protein n=1 Tax=Gossypium australe TaxID=47621 RepID=A0A5B6VJH7_9ROSI|nr:protein ecdysoneless-like protein [Gossypium australe]
MRIRKNKKLSWLIYPQGSRAESVHVCRLNQSPWDVNPLPQEPYPSYLHHRLEYEDSFNGNGGIGDSVGAVESEATMVGSKEQAIMKVGGMIIDDSGDNDEIKTAKKTQCQEEEALLQSSNNNSSSSSDSGNNMNPTSLTSKKADNQLTRSRRGSGARTSRRGGSSSASNLNDFYYYSGFGPSWGKRRHGRDKESEISKNLVEVEKNDTVTTAQNNSTLSSSSRIDDNEEFDYVEEEEEEDDENEYSGEKRTRKPIKARSLKSLM